MEADRPELGSWLHPLLKCDSNPVILLLSYAQLPQEKKIAVNRYNKNYGKWFLYLKEWACAKVTTVLFCLVKPDILDTFTNTPVKGKTEKHFN